MDNNNPNKKLMMIVAALSAAVILLLGIIVGYLVSNMGKKSDEPIPSVDTTKAPVEVVAESNEVAETVTEEIAQPVAETAQPVQTQPAKTVSEAKPEPAPVAQPEKKQEKTYGYYPSFYVKRQNFTVSHEDDDHTLIVYTDGSTKCVKAYTNKNWLEEEDLGRRGGNYFHVKRNRDEDSRSGELYLFDDKGRKITIYVTQKGDPDD